MTSTRAVPARRISFDDALARVPEYPAADDDLIMSHVVAVLSAVFPEGEAFFVRSVRRFRDEITDPELRRQVAGFIGQEAAHGREHRALNDRLAEHGYPTARIERFVRWGLGTRERLLPPKANLAATACLEHFTATFAEIILGDEEARELVAVPEVTELFSWHALEECEHKAVAFDVYQAVGGDERLRRITMNLTIVGFIGGMTVHLVMSLLADRNTYRWRRLRPSLTRLRRSPFLRLWVWRRLRDFNRPDFHPDDHDTDELLARWRQELFGPNGNLNDRLKGAAA